MSTSVHNLDFSGEGRVFIPAFFETKFSLEEEKVHSDLQFTSIEDNWWFTGMAKAPEHISDVVVNKLQEIAHVKAI